MKKMLTWCLVTVFCFCSLLQYPAGSYAAGYSDTAPPDVYEAPVAVVGANIPYSAVNYLPFNRSVPEMLLLFLLNFCYVPRGESAPDQISPPAPPRDKTITVVSETAYPPFEFTENGEYTGFDIDLIRAVCASQGYSVKIVSLGFDALIPALLANKADCSISAMTITPQRSQVVSFSQPYFTDGLVIVVRQGDQSIQSRTDLAGKKLAAEVGTLGKEKCNQIKEQFPTTTVNVYDSLGEAFLELENGRVDAVINDFATSSYYIAQSGKLKLVGKIMPPYDQCGIVMKKGNTVVQNIIDRGLQAVHANGTYDRLVAKWFGEMPPLE